MRQGSSWQPTASSPVSLRRPPPQFPRSAADSSRKDSIGAGQGLLPPHSLWSADPYRPKPAGRGRALFCRRRRRRRTGRTPARRCITSLGGGGFSGGGSLHVAIGCYTCAAAKCSHQSLGEALISPLSLRDDWRLHFAGRGSLGVRAPTPTWRLHFAGKVQPPISWRGSRALVQVRARGAAGREAGEDERPSGGPSGGTTSRDPGHLSESFIRAIISESLYPSHYIRVIIR